MLWRVAVTGLLSSLVLSSRKTMQMLEGSSQGLSRQLSPKLVTLPMIYHMKIPSAWLLVLEWVFLLSCFSYLFQWHSGNGTKSQKNGQRLGNDGSPEHEPPEHEPTDLCDHRHIAIEQMRSLVLEYLLRLNSNFRSSVLYFRPSVRL